MIAVVSGRPAGLRGAGPALQEDPAAVREHGLAAARAARRRLALHITGNAVSMPVLIGLLMLLGIVAKNSILLIDFAIEEMDKGVDKDEAIVDAGHKRAQPIVMTTVAMVAGMVPTALSLSGDGAGARRWASP